jgi:hypothetical protein
MDENDIGREVVDAATAVERDLGVDYFGVDYFGVWARGNLNSSEMLQKQ